MKPSDYYAAALKFYKYTGLDLGQFVDWRLSLALERVFFKMDEYLTFCQKNGMFASESVKEFNLRYWKNGDRVNAIIWDIIQ